MHINHKRDQVGVLEISFMSIIINCICTLVKIVKRVMDEEYIKDHFAEKSLDLVFSSLNLHWVNDLPGCFTAIRFEWRSNIVEFVVGLCFDIYLQEIIERRWLVSRFYVWRVYVARAT